MFLWDLLVCRSFLLQWIVYLHRREGFLSKTLKSGLDIQQQSIETSMCLLWGGPKRREHRRQVLAPKHLGKHW